MTELCIKVYAAHLYVLDELLTGNGGNFLANGDDNVFIATVLIDVNSRDDCREEDGRGQEE